MSIKNLNDALGLLLDAAEVRADQWKAAGDKDFYNIIDELYEADQAECENMADLIRAAINVVSDARKAGAFVTAEAS